MILDQIVATVSADLARRKETVPLRDLELLSIRSEAPRDFHGALQGDGVKVIAEVKRASPSKGWLNSSLDVVALVQSYTRGGAAAVSILTEPAWFRGSLDDLAAARRATHLPVLRKDFIIDPYQVYEARASGADAVLLIAALLPVQQLCQLIVATHDLGMAALVEVHAEHEVEQALHAEATLVGINNRNLADFTVDVATTLRLRHLIPPHVTVVSESGINSADDIAALQAAGVNAVLVGEALVTSANPEVELRRLTGSLHARH
ncbi:MAG: indole-3-glycerol phosphate synthase TrpC [Chloroflexi bacterium]|nr:MAG: indole-3-glycerol phosphate synthase TrpC [Chloroflexota bacterium]